MNTFFIGDTHFYHTNILRFCATDRPFDSIEEMNEVMVDRWNAAVSKQDTVIHVGDVVFGSRKADTGKENLKILDRLNGNKILIAGNHDIYGGLREYYKYFSKVEAMRTFEQNSLVTHIPVHPSQFPRWNFNIHGHLHDNHVVDPHTGMDDPRYINVSCENWDLTPVHKDVILDLARDRGLI